MRLTTAYRLDAVLIFKFLALFKRKKRGELIAPFLLSTYWFNLLVQPTCSAYMLNLLVELTS